MAKPPGSHINDRMYRSYDDRVSGEDTLQVVSPVNFSDAPLFVTDDRMFVTDEGALFTEGIIDHVRQIFSRDQGAASVAALVDVSAGGGGTATHDATEGQAVLAVGAGAGSVAYFETPKMVIYEPGRMLRGEVTIEPDDTNITGDASVEWGLGEDDGSGDILNGIYWRLDATGLRLRRKKNGVVVTDIALADANRDALDGVAPSRYRRGDSPVAIDPATNNYYLVQFEWLGAAPPSWHIQSPEGKIIAVHVEEFPGAGTGTTIPEPNLPLFVRVANDTTSGGAIEVRSGSMRAGTFANKVEQLGRQPDGDLVTLRADGLRFSNATPLGAAGVFLSDWFDTDGWASIDLFIAADQLSASQGIQIEFTDDATATTPTVRGTRLYTFDAPSVTTGFAVFRFPTELDGFRVRYTNGGTPQGAFYISATLRVESTNPQSSLETDLNASNIALMVRALLNARNDAGTYANLRRSSGALPGLRVSVSEHEASTPIRALTDFQTNQANVGTSAVQIVGSPLSGRKTVAIKALAGNNAKVYVGTAGVTTGNGFELNASEAIIMEIDDAAPGIFAISASGTQRVCWAEVA